MATCPICQHAKIQAIDAALASGRNVGVVAAQYRLVKSDLVKHLRLRHAVSASNDAPLPVRRPVAPALLQAAEQARRDDALSHRRPLAMVQEAWQEAKGDESEQARIVAWLNEQLQADGREF